MKEESHHILGGKKQKKATEQAILALPLSPVVSSPRRSERRDSAAAITLMGSAARSAPRGLGGDGVLSLTGPAVSQPRGRKTAGREGRGTLVQASF